MKIKVNKNNLQYIKEDLQYIKESIETNKNLKEDLRRWFKEKWVDVSRKIGGKHPPCGRKEADDKAYPKCRPSKKVSKDTPKLSSSYSKEEKSKMTSQKRQAEKNEPKNGKGNAPTMVKFDENLLQEVENNISYPTLVNENIEVSQELKSHIISKTPLRESTSDTLSQLLEESKDLYMNGDLELSDEDVKFIYESEYSIEETDFILSNSLNEAEYQGRTVKLNKVMQGDVKKFKVYVKNDNGRVIKVNFGFGGKSAKGKVMKIKKNNPERRKSFRARHKCSTATDKTTARYWSCKMW